MRFRDFILREFVKYYPTLLATAFSKELELALEALDEVVERHEQEVRGRRFRVIICVLFYYVMGKKGRKIKIKALSSSMQFSTATFYHVWHELAGYGIFDFIDERVKKEKYAGDMYVIQETV